MGGRDEDVENNRKDRSREDRDRRRRKERDQVDEEERHRSRHRTHRSRSEDVEERNRKRKKHRSHHHSRRDDEDDESDSRNDRDGERRRHSKHKKKKSSKKKHKSKRSDRDRDSSSDGDASSTQGRKRHSKRSRRDGKASKKRASSSSASFKPDKSKLYPMGDPVGKPPATRMDPENDYFTFHQQFCVYLYREEGIRFNDLTSEQAHEAFHRFASIYNKGSLEAPYYDSQFPKQVLEESKTTQHKWSFQTSETERRGLEALQDGVRRLTEYNNKSSTTSTNTHTIDTTSHGTKTKDISKADAKFDNDDRQRSQRKTPTERLEERRANRRLKDHVRNVQEELTGGTKDLREKQIEKRKEEAAKIHGAARDREAQQAGMELSDEALYGTDDRNSFQTALARQKNRKAQRAEQQKQRVQELQQKEQNRQDHMLQMLGLSALAPGQKIKIAPRQDNKP